jgi:hypothetical protein
MTTTLERIEFGFTRTDCSCRTCRRNCMFMPGFLIPGDLERMIPVGADPLQWSETNLLASPGAVVRVRETKELARIPTLVPATKDDGSCIHYRQRRCQIHDVAPFGCAFFDCGPERGLLSVDGLIAVSNAWRERSLYARLWEHLDALGKRQECASVLRERMRQS